MHVLFLPLLKCVSPLQVFFVVWQQREVQPQLRKLLAMWEGIFPQQLLNVLKQRVEQPVPAENAGMPRSGHSAQHQSNQWAQSQGPVHQPISFDTRNGYHAESRLTGRPMSASYQRPQYAHQQPAAFAASAAPVQSRQAPGHLWQSQQGAHVQYANVQQPSSQPLVLPNLLSSLLSSGLLTVPASVSIAAGPQAAGPALTYSHPQSRAATPEAVTAEDCKFVPSRLKVLSWSLYHNCCSCLVLLFVLQASQAFAFISPDCICACRLLSCACVHTMQCSLKAFEMLCLDVLPDIKLVVNFIVKIMHVLWPNKWHDITVEQ